MSKANKPLHRRSRKRLATLRDRLEAYGCKSNETVPASIDRLIREHADATARCAVAEKRAVELDKEATLARKTRDGAQKLATDKHTEAQKLRLENVQLRHEIEVMRTELAELRVDASLLREAVTKGASYRAPTPVKRIAKGSAKVTKATKKATKTPAKKAATKGKKR